MFSEAEFKIARAEFEREFVNPPDVLGTGGPRDGKLIVYVGRAEVLAKLPKSFRDIPIEPVLTGDIIAR